MKQKTGDELRRIDAAIAHLEFAKEQAFLSGEPNMANLISGLAGKFELLRAQAKAVGLV